LSLPSLNRIVKMGSLRAGDYDTVPGTTSTNPLGSVTMQPRTAALSRKVAAAKGLTLSVTEWATSVGLGTLFTLPFAGLTGFATIPTNTTTAIFRYGKVSAARRRAQGGLSSPLRRLHPGAGAEKWRRNSRILS